MKEYKYIVAGTISSFWDEDGELQICHGRAVTPVSGISASELWESGMSLENPRPAQAIVLVSSENGGWEFHDFER